MSGREDVAELFIKVAGKEENHKNKKRKLDFSPSQPLKMAATTKCETCGPDMTRFLIEHEADVNHAHGSSLSSKCRGFTPLMTAVARHNDVTAKILLETGLIQLEKTSHRSGTALSAAVTCGNLEMAKCLIASNANVMARNEHSGHALLGQAIDGRLGACVGRPSACIADIVRLLIDCKVNVKASGCNSTTPLFSAAKKNRKDLVEVLILEGKADVNLPGDFRGALPPFEAMNNGHFDVAKFMIEKGGADVDCVDLESEGHAPLVQAILLHEWEFGKHLLDQGANPNKCSSRNRRTPLLVLITQAAMFGEEKKKESIDFTRYLIDKGANIEVRGSGRLARRHRTPFFESVEQDLLEIASVLIKEGANVESMDKRDGATDLLKANSFRMSKLLIDNGADFNRKSKTSCFGCTHPVVAAAEKKQWKTALCMLVKGDAATAKNAHEVRHDTASTS
eukprot:jgi/Bigna1/134238/aug1.24_g8946